MFRGLLLVLVLVQLGETLLNAIFSYYSLTDACVVK